MLAGSGPHVLEVTVTLGQAVERVIALAAGADEAAQSVGVVLAGVAAVLVNLADGELNRGVVVGLDDAVGGAALARDVAGKKELVLVLDLPNLQFVLVQVHQYPALGCSRKQSQDFHCCIATLVQIKFRDPTALRTRNRCRIAMRASGDRTPKKLREGEPED